LRAQSHTQLVCCLQRATVDPVADKESAGISQWNRALPAFLERTSVEDFSALQKFAESGGFMR
jgi:hypothetical protein